MYRLGIETADRTQRGVRPEKLRAELAQSGRLGEVARMVRDQKASDRLVQQVKKVEVSADEWNKVFTAQQKATAEKRAAKRKSAGPRDEQEGAVV